MTAGFVDAPIEIESLTHELEQRARVITARSESLDGLTRTLGVRRQPPPSLVVGRPFLSSPISSCNGIENAAANDPEASHENRDSDGFRLALPSVP